VSEQTTMSQKGMVNAVWVYPSPSSFHNSKFKKKDAHEFLTVLRTVHEGHQTGGSRFAEIEQFVCGRPFYTLEKEFYCFREYKTENKSENRRQQKSDQYLHSTR
jgi:hypothetical protein